ncbi:hypothetical protein [Streptomyces clavuligerus]|uniref:hypothetical protein n=1 Tax=Streptomyces clavuligerus TaxID=1901 RepID=UPI0012FE82C4|nr:hypothetical protein [Streptomyces clavuligerus]MBY6307753.1 hypothetical protein [Streptomyces clavuligerus]QPJ98253.1 hypothetical protein GE265_35220 [Streptomyces clavuligerus]WDN56407.1 hypothetical protein LL058_31690 [Streptomyces clavuligerus]
MTGSVEPRLAGDACPVVSEDGVKGAGGGGSAEGDGLVVAGELRAAADEGGVEAGVGAYGRPVPQVLGRFLDSRVLDEIESGSLAFRGR